ncbi:MULTISPECIES: methylated-DNA--[protein]-cysteine S-methyltransferase [Arthrobacter]|uniref:Methylated-DNA--[protein]-cysteine S-methyltransferase n=2 Tax=Arthrobacter TaxID=1663 RepID=A0ABU9KM80_9MICC|nr:methylated-DNA--[protein]-cysteine S-methyltransferase [Arthrobacter sp. YJM1]MDP5227898.1 methylated-DNA--[protein]-cysteine S-methyltransferase [Arthrobacter sp. YJM1]
MADYTTLTTPDGPFTLIAQDGAVLAAGWTAELDELLPQVHASLRPAGLTEVATLGALSDAVQAYYDGDLAAPMSVPVRQKSGPFRERAWDVLREVAAGHPLSYTDYASAAGNPKAVRAAASACAFNAAALFVPCHRIVRNDGSLGGFRWGLTVKESLLAREAELSV